MDKIKYIFKRIKKMNFSSFINTIKRIHKKTGQSSLIIFFDIVFCGFKYMAGYVDYEIFEFYNLNRTQRKTIITRGINNKLVRQLNNPNYFKYIDDKVLFNKHYSSFLKRNWIDLRTASLTDFSNFVLTKKVFMAKAIDLCCGKGIEKFEYNSNINLEELYNKLKLNKQFLIEEYVVQHNAMNKLYPDSVNTLRIVTLLKNNKVHIVFSGLRIGNLGNSVDNFNHGGLLVPINNNGIIDYPAIDKNGNVYKYHPYTNTLFIGYQIPMFNQVIDFAKELALVIPQIRYTAWDIAITNNGPIVIEGNPFPGHDLYFSKLDVQEKHIGLLPKFSEILSN